MEMQDEYQQRAENFNKLRNQKPPVGSILSAKDGSEIPVHVQYRGDADTRTMFVNTAIDDEATGWYLIPGDRGLKCLILPNAQEQLIAENNGMSNGLAVFSLRVLRHTPSSSALLCEVIYE